MFKKNDLDSNIKNEIKSTLKHLMDKLDTMNIVFVQKERGTYDYRYYFPPSYTFNYKDIEFDLNLNGVCKVSKDGFNFNVSTGKIGKQLYKKIDNAPVDMVKSKILDILRSN